MSRHSIYHQHHPSLSSSNTSTLHTSSTTAVTNALQTRINAKRAELENLKQLRDLSATLASQMTVLEQKLSTLRDGIEAVAHVLANWDNVLNVVGMVGAGAANLLPGAARPGGSGDDGKGGGAHSEHDEAQQLPETLVRIPVQEGSAKEPDTAGV